MKKKTIEAVEHLITELGNEYDDEDQIIIHTGLYRHSDGELYRKPEK